jgi:CubicO group peptidase (beta-lactamase class C family)
VGHSGPVRACGRPDDGGGGLWASATDLALFLEFQLGDGTIDGRVVLDAALMQQMRTIPAAVARADALAAGMKPGKASDLRGRAQHWGASPGV